MAHAPLLMEYMYAVYNSVWSTLQLVFQMVQEYCLYLHQNKHLILEQVSAGTPSTEILYIYDFYNDIDLPNHVRSYLILKAGNRTRINELLINKYVSVSDYSISIMSSVTIPHVTIAKDAEILVSKFMISILGNLLKL